MLFPLRVTATRKFRFVLPWLLIAAMGAVAILRAELWPHELRSRATTGSDTLAHSLAGRHRVEVLQVLDGDTFLARLRLDGGRRAVTRVRLRGIDTAEMDAQCVAERRLAERATQALRNLLREGDVSIFDIGPDRYAASLRKRPRTPRPTCRKR